MEKITNINTIKRGESLTFDYKGKKAILIRTKDAYEIGGRLFAYIASCPHEKGTVNWDEEARKLVCEDHLSLFNVNDGSVYKTSILIKMKEGARLPKIELKLDRNGDIYAI